MKIHLAAKKPRSAGRLPASMRLPGSDTSITRPVVVYYLAAGKTKDAIAQCTRVVAGREHVLGADHPDTLAARARLAAAYDAAGQMGAALQQHQVVCAGYERVFGADHPGTLA
jgi:hypothetical protein